MLTTPSVVFLAANAKRLSKKKKSPALVKENAFPLPKLR